MAGSWLTPQLFWDKSGGKNVGVAGPSPPPLAVTFQARLCKAEHEKAGRKCLFVHYVGLWSSYEAQTSGFQHWLDIYPNTSNDEYLLNISIK